CDSMRGWGLQPAALATGNVVAVGPKTASALGREGVKVALVAEETTAEGVLAALTDAGGLAGARVLIPCAQGAREVLPQGLRAAGAVVEVIPVYVTTQETGNPKGLPEGRGDAGPRDGGALLSRGSGRSPGAPLRVKPLRLGTRGSALARWQADWVKARLAERGVAAELVIVKTRGDAEVDRPLQQLEGKGFFTKEIEDALLAERIDVAVHSLKDLP